MYFAAKAKADKSRLATETFVSILKTVKDESQVFRMEELVRAGYIFSSLQFWVLKDENGIITEKELHIQEIYG